MRMQIEELHIDKTKIRVRSEDILSLLGDGESGGLDGYTQELIQQYSAECMNIMSPQGGYSQIDSQKAGSKDLIEIHGIQFDTGNIIHKMLRFAKT